MELMVILVLALVIFGPGKLPEIAGQVGRVVRDFRRTTADLSSEFNRTLSLEIEERKATQAPAPAPVAVAEEAPAPAYDTYSAPAVEPAPPAPAAVEPTEAPPLAVTPVSPAVAEAPVAATAAGSKSRRDYDADIAPPY